MFKILLFEEVEVCEWCQCCRSRDLGHYLLLLFKILLFEEVEVCEWCQCCRSRDMGHHLFMCLQPPCLSQATCRHAGSGSCVTLTNGQAWFPLASNQAVYICISEYCLLSYNACCLYNFTVLAESSLVLNFHTRCLLLVFSHERIQQCCHLANLKSTMMT